MTKEPFISHSDLTNEIYIVCGTKKYLVTEQVIKAMQNTGRLEQQPSDDCVSLKEVQKWIPIVIRKPTEEEKKDYFEQNHEELCYMIDSLMPNHGQEVLVTDGKSVTEDVFDMDFWNFENWDIENVIAWMPLPEPYKAEMESEDESM